MNQFNCFFVLLVELFIGCLIEKTLRLFWRKERMKILWSIWKCLRFGIWTFLVLAFVIWCHCHFSLVKLAIHRLSVFCFEVIVILWSDSIIQVRCFVYEKSFVLLLYAIILADRFHILQSVFKWRLKVPLTGILIILIVQLLSQFIGFILIYFRLFVMCSWAI